MSSLNAEQKLLLFDYCMGLTSESETSEIEQLIAANKEASEICAKIKASLSSLDTFAVEPCPDDLAEGTIWRLNNLARASQLQLEKLLADEQARSTSSARRFWSNAVDIIAAAAVILLISGVLMVPLKQARQASWQQACQLQLKRIWQGVTNYSNDHDGRMPSVSAKAGSPWWKVGYQGKENHSNTRNIWLLARGGYVNPTDFVCPGKSQGRISQLDPEQAKNYSDFPARRYITYSFRIGCDKSRDQNMLGRKVLISDLNPLFEKLPHDYSRNFRLQLTDKLLRINSGNHNRCGQNVLFGDGAAEFVRNRTIGISQDDIFTLQNTDVYQGTELPSCETDAFLAP